MFFYRIFLPENTNLKSLWLLPAITLLAIAHVTAAPLTFLSEQNPPVNYEDSRQKAAGFSVELLRLVWQKMSVPQQPIKFLRVPNRTIGGNTVTYSNLVVGPWESTCHSRERSRCARSTSRSLSPSHSLSRDVRFARETVSWSPSRPFLTTAPMEQR